MLKFRVVALALIVCFLTMTPRQQVAAVKPVRDLSAYAPGEIIVKLKDSVDNLTGAYADGQPPITRAIAELGNDFSAQSIEPLAPPAENRRVDAVISRRGLDRTFVLKFSNEAEIESIIAELEASGLVEYAEPNYRIKPGTVIPNDPDFTQQWGLLNLGTGVGGDAATYNADIKATEAWEITTGSPDVIIALTDTGVDLTHPDLAESIYTNAREIAGNGVDDDRNGYIDDVHGYNVADANGDTSDVTGHGTQMAGIIAARLNNQIGISGVCQSKILPVKFFRRTGPFPEDFEATVANAARALLYSITAGASIINASWTTLLLPGHVADDHAQALKDAVAATSDAGALLVCIAGNDGFNVDYSSIYPGAYQLPNQIVVAASDYNDEIWHPAGDPFTIISGFGQRRVHLAAPGVSVFTTFARGNCISCSDSTDPREWYGRIDGTSASAAFVSGVAALIKSIHPDEYVTLVRRRIVESADLRDQLREFAGAGGRLNALGALTIQLKVTPPVITKVKYKAGGGKLYIYGDGMQRGAVAIVGNTTYSTKPKSEDLSRLLASVPASAFPSGVSVQITLRNPDGGVSQPLTFRR